MRFGPMLLIASSLLGAGLGAWQTYRPGSLPNLIVAAGLASDDLVGLSPKRLKRLFGVAGFVRIEGDVEVWQYQAATCTLDLFLYPDAAGGKLLARYAELRPRQLEVDFSENECLAELRE
jgi:hypothetical protein